MDPLGQGKEERKLIELEIYWMGTKVFQSKPTDKEDCKWRCLARDAGQAFEQG